MHILCFIIPITVKTFKNSRNQSFVQLEVALKICSYNLILLLSKITLFKLFQRLKHFIQLI